MLSTGKLFLSVKAKAWAEELLIRRYFYSNVHFRHIDRTLRKIYRFRNPYRISRRFLSKKGTSDIHQYGETPIPVFAQIAKECALTEHDKVIELGCGRGRGAFFWSAYFGCSVHGVDWNPKFIDLATRVVERTKCPRISFSCQSLETVETCNATFIYLYGTCLEDVLLEKLATSLEKARPGTKIITISYPLTDYSKNSSFRVEKQFSVCLPWGETDAYLNIRV